VHMTKTVNLRSEVVDGRTQKLAPNVTAGSRLIQYSKWRCMRDEYARVVWNKFPFSLTF